MDTSNEKEVWKDIVGWEGKYQISNFGDVKSLRRWIAAKPGYWSRERILVKVNNAYGYYMVNLPVGNRRSKSIPVHRLVASHFLDSTNKKDKHEICHKDGDRKNNHFLNLYYGDNESNVMDRYKQGRTKLTPDQVRQIRDMPGKQKVIADMFGVRASYVSRLKNYKRGKYII